ncbi:MAG TPA: type II secretion system F family protein [Vitreimonas sp.]|uniref:type II secretion system F family protein n=1 Tax=Vitreimonas sp. TaxID=3069702 RepID=UPI002D6AF653|nr:type II secretion system F family protein [Vitreimonas sp.]HYD86607.1 type II secretion system F family protein [Vitreimonas sp.]
MDPAIVAAVLAFVAIGGAGIAFSGGGQPAAASKRVKAVAGATKVDRRKQATEMAALKRKQTTQEALRELSASEKQSRKRRFSVKGQIAQAGIKLSVPAYWMMAVAAGLALALVGFLVSKHPVGALAGLFIGALGLPRWVLSVMVGGRQKKFSNQLADAIDVIVRGVKSGLPLGQCLRIIASESPEPLRSEFQALVDSQAMGVPLETGMQRMYDRMPLPEVNFFSIVLVIQQKTGGNLSESLGNLSSVLRSRKLMKEKVKALSAEAKASAGIIGSLPVLVGILVWFTRPAYIAVLFEHPVGNLILLGCAVMMSMGIFVMHKMVNFKF